MHLVIASRSDRASMSMAEYVLDNVSLTQSDTDSDVYQNGDYRLKFIDERHLYFDRVPQEQNGITPEISDVTFLSSHSSSAQIKSLTAHPTGNFSDARLGGRENTLSVTSPEMMTTALKVLNRAYQGDGFEVTLEATHHGPYLEIPNYYIEIGTTENEWKDRSALEAVSEAVFAEPEKSSGNYVGAGGGHYMPKVTNYVINNDVSVGHLISKHHHDTINLEQIEEAVDKTPDCRGFIMDKKGCRGRVRSMINEICDARGMEIIRL